jgi:hypothetical protein
MPLPQARTPEGEQASHGRNYHQQTNHPNHATWRRHSLLRCLSPLFAVIVLIFSQPARASAAPCLTLAAFHSSHITILFQSSRSNLPSRVTLSGRQSTCPLMGCGLSHAPTRFQG